jgi:DNA polymerase-3 subunit alpha
LFGLFDAAAPKSDEGSSSGDQYPEVEEWDRLNALSLEKQALGCYVSGHPLHRYGAKLARLGVTEAVKLAGLEAWTMTSVAGMVEGYREKIFKGGSGGKAAFFDIEDMSGRVGAKIRGDRVETCGPLLASGEPVLVTGKVSFPITDEPVDEPEPTLLVDSVEPLAQAVHASTRGITIRLKADTTGQRQMRGLKTVLDEHPGQCPVELVISLPDGADAVLAVQGRVESSDHMLSGLERLFGDCVTELR